MACKYTKHIDWTPQVNAMAGEEGKSIVHIRLSAGNGTMRNADGDFLLTQPEYQQLESTSERKNIAQLSTSRKNALIRWNNEKQTNG